MLFIANWLVLFVFLYFAVKVWRQGKTRLTIICATLWLIGKFVSLNLEVNAALIFIPYAAGLCLILIYNHLINEHMPGRRDITAEQLLNEEDPN